MHTAALDATAVVPDSTRPGAAADGLLAAPRASVAPRAALGVLYIICRVPISQNKHHGDDGRRRWGREAGQDFVAGAERGWTGALGVRVGAAAFLHACDVV